MDGDDVPTIMARPIKRQHSNVAKLMAEACQSGDEATLVALIDKYGNVDEHDSRGNTPLMHAAWNGHVHLVDLLIKRGANVNARNARQNTALHFAHERGNIHIQKLIVENGGHKSKMYRNSLGLTPENLTPSHYLIESPDRGTDPMVDVMLESVFLSTVGHRATMSVAHELPAALRTLGLHWSVELGEALVEGGVQFMLRRAASLPPPEATAPKQRGSRRFLVPAKVFLQRKNLHSLSSPPPRSPVTGGPDAGDDDGGFPGTARSPGGAVPPPPPTESGAGAAAPTTPGAARPPAVPIAATPPHMRSLQHSLHATQSAGNLMPHLQLHERARRARTHGVSILDFATFCEICVQLKGHRLFAHEAPRGAHKWSGGTRLVQDVSMDARHFQAAMAAASLNDGVKIKMAAAPRIVTQVHRAFDMQRPAGARTAPAKAQSTGFWASSTATTTTSVGAGAGAAAGDAGGAGSGSGSGANAAEWDARSVLSEATQPDVDGTAGAAASAAAAAPQRTRDGGDKAAAAAAAVASGADAEAGAGGVTTGAVAAPPAEDGDEAPQSTPEPAPSVDTAERSNQFSQVFLGGACNPTTWRHDYAMPALEEAGITFFNPQVDEWHPGLVAIEATAKLNARIILFVVASETRGVASMVEAAEFITSGREVVLVLEPVPEDAVFNGEALHAAEIKDLNRGRTYLHDVAQRHGTAVYTTVEDAVTEIIKRWRTQHSFGHLHTTKEADNESSGSGDES